MQAFTNYVLRSASKNKEVHTVLQALLSPAALQSQNHVGFVFSERLRNMPVQVVPPMYKMLEEELGKVASFIDAGTGPYLGGPRPLFADLAFIAWLLSLKDAAPEEEWRRMTTEWQGGRWGKLLEQSKDFIKDH